MADLTSDTEDFAKRLGFGKSCEEEPCGDPNCPALKKHDCVGGEYVPVATLREPSEKEIARGDVVSVAFIQCRIDYLLQQHELCGCVGLVDTCDECKKRDFAIRELQACL